MRGVAGEVDTVVNLPQQLARFAQLSQLGEGPDAEEVSHHRLRKGRGGEVR